MGESRWLVVSVPDSSKRLVKHHKSKKRPRQSLGLFFVASINQLKWSRWIDDRPPHVSGRAIIEPKPFLRLLKVAADDVNKWF